MLRRCVFINLLSRPDRHAHFLQQVQASSLLQTWEPTWYPALTPQDVRVPSWWPNTPGFYASRRSHLTVLERALIDGVTELLVLEDDLLIPRPAAFQSAWDEMEVWRPPDWMGVQFGGYHTEPGRDWVSKGRATFLRLHGFLECPAMLLSRSGMEHVWDQQNRTPDRVYDWGLLDIYKRCPHFYAPDPLPVTQYRNFSDSEGKVNH